MYLNKISYFLLIHQIYNNYIICSILGKKNCHVIKRDRYLNSKNWFIIKFSFLVSSEWYTGREFESKVLGYLGKIWAIVTNWNFKLLLNCIKILFKFYIIIVWKVNF